MLVAVSSGAGAGAGAGAAETVDPARTAAVKATVENFMFVRREI